MKFNKIFVFLIMGLFMISMVSAFLDVKSFNPNARNHGEIQFDDWLFMNKADYRLIDYGSSVVDVWAEGEYKLHKKTHLFTGVFYKDVMGNRGNLEDVEFFIWNDQFKTKYNPIYEDQKCMTTGKNFTQVCDSVLISNESFQEDQSGWIVYEKGMDLNNGEGKWRMEAKRKANKPIDFILEGHGKTFDEWAWFNSSWEYRKEINIKENSGSDVTNYSVPINVTYDSDMNVDFSDLRFVNDAGDEEYYYWIDYLDEIDSDHALVYVTIPTITASINTSIWMYYGNSLASSNSDTEMISYYRDNFSDYTLAGSVNSATFVTDSYAQIKADNTYYTYRKPNPYVNNGNGNWKLETDIQKLSQYDYSNGINIGFFDDTTSFLTNSFFTGMVSHFSPSKTLSTPFRIQSHNASSLVIYDGLTQSTNNNQIGYFNITGDSSAITLVSMNLDGSNIFSNSGGYSKTPSQLENYNYFGIGTHIKTDTANTKYFEGKLLRTELFWNFPDTPETYVIGAEESSNSLEVISHDPSDNLNTTSTSIDFNCSANDEIGVYSLNLTIGGSVYETVTGAGNTNLSLTSTETLTDGEWVWSCSANDDVETKTSTSRSLIIDSTAPILNAFGIEDLVTFTLPINSSWNYTATDTHIDQCYYNTTANATQTVITCGEAINTTWTTGGNKTLTYCANDTFGLETCETDYVYVSYITDSQAESQDPTVEGSTVTWNLSVDMTNIPTTTATLVIDGTNYAPTTTLSDANGYLFEVSKQIPDTWGNTTGNLINWSWNYTIDGIVTSQQMETTNITVYELAVDDCSVFGDVILEMNLRDEETADAINGSAGSNIEIDLEIINIANSSISLTYNNTWTDNETAQVCLPNEVLNNSQFSLDFTVGFSSTDHVWEFYYLDNGTLNASKVYDVQTTTPINLFDLLTADSTSFLFNYFDQDGLPVADAIVHVYRQYIGSGVFLEVERAKADNNGDTIVHLVEEDVIYYFLISRNGEILFTSSQYTALCQATPCAIQIEASGTGATFDDDGTWDLIDGGAYSISSSASTREVTLDYALEESGTFNLTVYRYESDGSYSIINTSSDTGTSGSVVLDVPQSAGNVSFFASVVKDDEFVNSEWVNFVGNPQDRFGITMSLFLAFLIILSLGLMAVSEGVGTLVWVLLGVFLAGALGLMTIELSTGVNVVVYLILAGGILLWKLTGGRR